MLSPSTPSASTSSRAASAIRRSVRRFGTVLLNLPCTVYGVHVQRTYDGTAAPVELRRGPLLRLSASVGLSLFGSEITVLALPLTAVAVLDASAGQVALLAAAGTAPFLLLGLPARGMGG